MFIAFKVDFLPDILFDIGEIYLCLMPLDSCNASRALFFVFQSTVGEPVTIWLIGGPGKLNPRL